MKHAAQSFSLVLALALSVATPARAELPDHVPTSAFQPIPALQATARREGLMVVGIEPMGADGLLVHSIGNIDRQALLKRISLVAYATMPSASAIRRVQFEHVSGGRVQTCEVYADDLGDYLASRIDKAEYQRRLNYADLPLPPQALPTLPPLPGFEQPVVAPPGQPDKSNETARNDNADAAVGMGLPGLRALESVKAPALPEPSMVTQPTAPWLTGTWHAGYAMGFGATAHDAFSLEYAHAVLPALEVRPALWILSGFSPLNRMAPAGSGIEGLSGSFDMVGSTRPQVGPDALAWEGGLGARATTLQGGTGVFPAMHLRLGARWKMLAVSMRYPLLSRTNDPTATWEATTGLAWQF